MRTRRLAAFAALTIAAVGAAPAAAFADTGTGDVIYVNSDSTACTDSGTGTSAAPFCTLQAGVDAATAGNTVEVSGGGLYAPVTISNSGTAAAPITIEGQTASSTYIGSPSGTADPAPGFTLDGAAYVNISHFTVTGASLQAATVTDSNNVTLDSIKATLGTSALTADQPGIEVAGSSSDITISRGQFRSGPRTAPAVQIDAGSSGDVFTTNELIDSATTLATTNPAMIAVLGATNTAITSNTVDLGVQCDAAVSVSGASGGSTIENNILETTEADCEAAPAATALVSVSESAASPVTADYNLLFPQLGGAGELDYYSWNGTLYSTLSAFTATTGEGSHDLAADPQFYYGTHNPSASSPAINSANSAAPGTLSTDINSYACSYDPYAAITGAGDPAYCTRGAVQYQSSPLLAVYTLAATGALSVTATIAGQVPVNPQGYTYQWGDGQSTQTTNTTETHRYTDPGTYTVTVTVTDAIGQSSSTQSTFDTAGSDFTAYGPIRLLDTRHGIGAPQEPVTANSTVKLKIAGDGSIPTGVTAVALNLTAVDGTGSGFVTAYGDGGTKPSVSNLNYGGGQTVANEAIVPVAPDGYIDLTNSTVNSTISVDLIADVTGYFTRTAAAGFDAVAPARILDTRKGLGATEAKVGPHGSIALGISGADGGALPTSGITAVSLHVTAVDTTASGFVTAYPDGEATPTASNLNYTTGSTVSNTVIVPVGADGKIDLYNGSPSGSTDLIADVSGYYTTTQNSTISSYIPLDAPYRAIDTRKQFQPVWSGTSVTMGQLIPGATAYVMNLTAVQGTGNGFLTAAPAGGAVPNVSNVNYLANQTVANLAQVATGSTSSGPAITITNSEPSQTSDFSVEVIADAFGYYSHI